METLILASYSWEAVRPFHTWLVFGVLCSSSWWILQIVLSVPAPASPGGGYAVSTLAQSPHLALTLCDSCPLCCGREEADPSQSSDTSGAVCGLVLWRVRIWQRSKTWKQCDMWLWLNHCYSTDSYFFSTKLVRVLVKEEPHPKLHHPKLCCVKTTEIRNQWC